MLFVGRQYVRCSSKAPISEKDDNRNDIITTDFIKGSKRDCIKL